MFLCNDGVEKTGESGAILAQARVFGVIDALSRQRPGQIRKGPSIIRRNDHVQGIRPGLEVSPTVSELFQPLCVDVANVAARVHFLNGFRQQFRQFAESLLVLSGLDHCSLDPQMAVRQWRRRCHETFLWVGYEMN